MTFKKINESKKIYIKVAEQILEVIKEGNYQRGDRLPPERVLVDEMGVSRNSIREALGVLRVLKIVESKTGDGTYVRNSPGRSELESYVLPVLKDSESPLVVFDARSTFEPGVFEMAIANTSSEDLKDLKKLLGQMQKLGRSKNYERYYEINTKFHLKIAKIVDNHIVRDTMITLWESTDQPLLREMVIDYWGKNMDESLKIHKQIFEAFKKKNVVLAKEIIRKHYEYPKKHFSHFLKSRGKIDKL